MKPPKIIIPIDVVDIKECVYKLFYGDKYVIIMAKSTYRSIWAMNDDIARYHKGINEKFNKNNLYSKFYKFILNNPAGKFSFEMILVTNNSYQLLKCCQIALDKAKRDDNCLNSFFTVYMNPEVHLPFYKQRKTKWWVNKGAYLNFRKFMKRKLIVKD